MTFVLLYPYFLFLLIEVAIVGVVLLRFYIPLTTERKSSMIIDHIIALNINNSKHVLFGGCMGFLEEKYRAYKTQVLIGFVAFWCSVLACKWLIVPNEFPEVFKWATRTLMLGLLWFNVRMPKNEKNWLVIVVISLYLVVVAVKFFQGQL